MSCLHAVLGLLQKHDWLAMWLYYGRLLLHLVIYKLMVLSAHCIIRAMGGYQAFYNALIVQLHNHDYHAL